jgi:hypothetical protein
MPTTRIRFAVPAVLAGLMLVSCAGFGSSEAPTIVTGTPAESSATPSPTVAPSDRPTATATPEPSVELGYGALVELAEAVDVRMGPFLDASVVGMRPAGPAQIGMDDLLQSGYLLGPIEADELVWFPMLSSDGQIGWVGQDASAWETLPADCPETEVPSAADFVEMAPAERVACFGDRNLVIVADVPLSGLGGSRMGSWTPAWLAYPLGPSLRVPADGKTLYGPVIHFAPGVEAPELPPDATGPTMRLEVTLHVDDPAAEECVVDVPSTPGPENPEAVRQYCRTQVVATSLRPVE